jgi:hypothetical protein
MIVLFKDMGLDKEIRWPCGGRNYYDVALGDIVQAAAKEFPGVPLGDLAITITNDAEIGLRYKPAKQQQKVG